jgi:drug/metabolite transporter (DMT)-like permease
LLLVLAGLVRGEWTSFDIGAVSARSFVALLYLLVFGSLIGFTAYIYLLGATTPSRVSTYGFVNPVVAVALGWAFAGEMLTPRTLVAAAIITTAVIIIVTAGDRRRARHPVPRRSEPQPGPSCLDEPSRASV